MHSLKHVTCFLGLHSDTVVRTILRTCWVDYSICWQDMFQAPLYAYIPTLVWGIIPKHMISHCLALHIKLQCFLTAGSVLFTHLFDRIEDIDLCRH